MELSSSAVTGAMRVGLTVLSSHKQPKIEVYHQLRHRVGPEQELVHPTDGIVKHRFSKVFIEFFMVNIGGERAENIKITVSGDLRRNKPKEAFGSSVDTLIPQMAPSQLHYLFQFGQFDLLEYGENGESPKGLKSSHFTLCIEYDAPKGLINWFMSLWNRFRGKRRFETVYTFKPQMVDGDLPAPEYA